MKLKIQGTNNTVEINKSHFKAQGGEGSIYVKNGTVYKVCEKGKMIPEGKFQELSVLNKPNIIKPEQVLLDSRNKPVGYTMKLVHNAVPLAQVLTKSYREREGLTVQDMSKLIQSVRDGIEYIHSKNILQVDGNEMNYMVTNDYKEIYFIDVNSFQTKHYPAEAIMLSIRDWHVENKNGVHIWTELSDWFSFAIISFYMWTGLHPFKGRNPQFTNLKTLMVDQMKANVSVLNPETKFPAAAAYPFTVIPDVYMEWYKALFERGERHPAPLDFKNKAIIIPKIKEIIGGDNFIIENIHEFEDAIIGFLGVPNIEVVTTKKHVVVNRTLIDKPKHKMRIGLSPTSKTPVMAHIENNTVHLTNLKNQENIPFSGYARDLMSCEGRLYIHGDDRIMEIQLTESGGGIFAGSVVVANVSSQNAQMFQGVVIQTLFEGYFVSIFSDSYLSHQHQIKELNDYKITEAKYERGVLMIVGMINGQYDRFIIRFNKDYSSYEIARKIENIAPTGLNFTVLDNGICVSITEEEKIEIFSSRYESKGVKSIEDPVIEGDMRLCSVGSQVMFAKGNKLFKLNMK